MDRNRANHAYTALLAAPRFEILPLASVLDETSALPEGTVVTVTASPRRGLDATVETCQKLAAQQLRAVPHLAARQVTGEEHLRELLDRLAGSGIDEVFVVGGDAAVPAGPYADGLALLRAMAGLGRLPATVGVPAYPEGHPVLGERTLWSALHAKQAYASYVVTQLCFEARAVCRFAAAARDRGITLPVVAGVPGAVDTRTLLRMSVRIGVGDSLRFAKGHRSLAGRLLRPGAYLPDALVGELAARADAGECAPAGLHFYTFNRLGATARWAAEARRRAG
ncbi:methylenetetrahydrofolate reductase [Prauserella muralis]|uniref:Methylenetetrahydrofolate reductase n=1 Tax=Prauserella muralis TaxID=588067 RepID=A0A2V4API8_9PSEU|nr:methylenetetrahydrofolate reductase [Prauserella muralis]PXY22623.1 methylenetetrahydrofolate reductase [Prauserella muralis]TWE28330.1 methylenetetrahydrofolate reductase (NADPH) [Prauserella muralis]